MAPYAVLFNKSAKKEFEDLPERIQKKVIEVLALLAQNPRTEVLQIKKLKGAESLFRVRLGDWRLVYEIQDAVLTVLVIKIGHRREVYR